MSPTGGPWFAAGLRFDCQRCGNCCTGAPGYVWVTEAEAAAMAKHLGLTLDAFGRRYLRQVARKQGRRSGLSLLESPDGGCVFYDHGRCKVHAVKPMQCKTYPFWPEIMRTPGTWAAEARYCAGVAAGEAGRGRTYSVDEIRRIMRGMAGTVGVSDEDREVSPEVRPPTP